MKIGMCFLRLANGGGCYQLINLAKRLQAMGHQVTIVSYFRPRADFARENLEGLTVIDCEVDYQETKKIEWQPIGLFKYYVQILKMVWGMYQKIRQLDFEVVNPHEWLSHYPAVWYKWRHAGVRLVWMCNDVWHIPGNEETEEKRWLFKWIHRLVVANFDRLMVRQIDLITVLDHRIMKIVKRFYPSTKVLVVRSGVDAVSGRQPVAKVARKRLGLDQADYIILCFSIFYRHRRFEDVIRAVEKARKKVGRKMKLVIVGSEVNDVEYAGYIKRLVVAKKLTTAVSVVAKYVTVDQKKDYLVAADVFVYPNQIQTWGLIVIEAMAAGLPCIVSTGAGVHEVIADGVTGLIYPVTDWQALAGKLEYAYRHRAVMSRIAGVAQEYVKQNLSWGNYAKSMEKAFES